MSQRLKQRCADGLFGRTEVRPYRKERHERGGVSESARALLIAAVATTIALGGSQLQAQIAPAFADLQATDRVLAGNAPAYHALMEGRVEDAEELLNARLAAAPQDGTAHQLLCRVYYAQDVADAAIHECEMAVGADPGNSEHHLWLGRAYGMKARHAGPFAGFLLARKVNASFAEAVRLDAANVAAIGDLGEYYIAAPSIVGGGLDKAKDLAERTMPRFPAAAHRLLALIAQSDKDATTAEAEFKLAVAAGRSPEAWIDLAHFYEKQSRPDDAVAAIKSGLAADRSLPAERAHGPVLVDAASILTAAHRSPDLAERCLRDYLAGRAKSDGAPAFKVHLQLSQLLAARGDSADANKEAATAAALAPAFTHGAARPAQGF